MLILVPPKAQRRNRRADSVIMERTHTFEWPRLTARECAIIIAVATALSVGIGLLSGLSLVEALHFLRLV